MGNIFDKSTDSSPEPQTFVFGDNVTITEPLGAHTFGPSTFTSQTDVDLDLDLDDEVPSPIGSLNL